jgi:hypothetical protein
LEEVGKDAGLPLGRGLTDWRKIVVGDRNWWLIFTTDSQETVATVWVIGDHDDAVCYEAAERRVRAFGKAHPQAASLAAVMFQLSQMPRAARRRKRRHHELRTRTRTSGR